MLTLPPRKRCIPKCLSHIVGVAFEYTGDCSVAREIASRERTREATADVSSVRLEAKGTLKNRLQIQVAGK